MSASRQGRRNTAGGRRFRAGLQQLLELLLPCSQVSTPLLLLPASLVMQLNPTRHTAAAAVPGVTTCLLVRMIPRALSTMKPDA